MTLGLVPPPLLMIQGIMATVALKPLRVFSQLVVLVVRFLASRFDKLWPLILVLYPSGCARVSGSGTLLVHFLSEGSYEIYKIASESPLQFISEESGQFNAEKSLSPGSYLILADCSSQIVNIYPGNRIELTAHKINFVPMRAPRPQDKFSVQCERSYRSQSRQHVVNRFSLAVLSGVREFLVGMVPLQMNLEAGNDVSSRLITYRLSSLSVSRDHEKRLASQNDVDHFEFFVTPTSEVAPYTESQLDNGSLFLLRGQYRVQLNGTAMDLDLADGESRVIIPANLKVEVSGKADLDHAEKIKGSPLFVEVNGEHFLHLNSTYPVLPGTISIRLSTMLKPLKVVAKEGEFLKMRAKNVLVELGCEAENWSCLGSRKVRVFEHGKSNYFAESVSDTPLLFFGDLVAVGIEGSRNLKFEIGGADDQIIKIGYVEIQPTPMHKPGMLTDLVRLEPAQSQIVGATLDLPLDKSSVLPVPVGHYNLAQYTFFSGDGSRRKSTASVYVGFGEKVQVPITTFLTEKRMSTLDGTTGPQTTTEDKSSAKM
jgi:hypothetical protein